MAKRLKGVPNLPFAPIVSALFGLVSAILVFATPAWLLERAVSGSGISSVVAAAQPPLGDTARTLIAVLVGISVGLILWLIMRPIEKAIHSKRTGKRAAPSASQAEVYEGRSPADRLNREGREPIFAGYDLGAPLMSDEALASGEELLLDRPMTDAPPLAGVISPYDAPIFDPATEGLSSFDDVLPLEVETNEEASPVREEPLVLEPPTGWDSYTEVPEEEAPVLELNWGSLSPGHVGDSAPEMEQEPEPLVPEPYEPVTFEVASVPESVELDEGDIPAPGFSTPMEAIEPVPEMLDLGKFQDSEPAVEFPAARVESLEASLAPVEGEEAEEPSLSELLTRLETALDRRAALAVQGRQISDPPAPATVSSLRELLTGGRKSVA